ncbi:hypothetical protein [Cesiribacter sp. SM1]|uniref:hypothetical protein n=1 Tax=Cesiribacter sp. SM1 TaxID=2861196 RepID=UPI001CD3ABAA|nr:hypothetical protein [Cesiribacter sp. SM1]
MDVPLLLRRNRLTESYLAFWLLLFFVTSIVVFPSVKGTTPAYLLTFLSLPLAIIFSRYKSSVYITRLCLALSIVFILALLSQLNVLLFEHRFPSSENLILISQDKGFFLRSSFFTQHLYLFVCLLAFVYVYVYYQSDFHDSYLYAGAVLLLIYGFYEEIYFVLTGTYGDFLSNRVFGEDGSGSLLQSISFGGIVLQRFKSLTGEPSMYALTVFPVFIYAYFSGKTKIAYAILISLVLSFSTTFYLGLAILLTGRFLQRGIRDKLVFFSLFGAVVLFILFLPTLIELFEEVVWQKLTAKNASGAERSTFFINHFSFFVQLPFFVQLTGVGFGTVRSTDFFTTILVNSGYLGFFTFTFAFLYPVFKLRNGKRQSALRYSLVFLYLSMMIAVPEYSYLVIWLFLGLAYNQLKLDYNYESQQENSIH